MPDSLAIVGGGAAGLMAAVSAAEAGVPAVLLERRHRPGLKLLMCGNNRCNISHLADAAGMARLYGAPVGSFLRPALDAFPPDALRDWFARAGLRTIVRRDRIYPASEDADDVLHCFLDRLRELKAPIALNCPVQNIVSLPGGGFSLTAENGFLFRADRVLIATGGVSYPKTGSVGDGLRFASALHHKVTPLRPGLAGMCVEGWLADGKDCELTDVLATLESGGRVVGTTRGNVLCAGGILRGTAVFDASRLVARLQLRDFSLYFDLFPTRSEREVASALGRGTLATCLEHLGIPRELSIPLAGEYTRHAEAADFKRMPVRVSGIRPLKEAIVTVGGVSLEEIDPRTMQSRLCPGLYFAGEVMDVDGPTGGFNLHAAFATARLAVADIAGLPTTVRRSRAPRAQDSRARRRYH